MEYKISEVEKKEILALGKCPICKEGDVVEKAKSFACTKSSWKNDGCNYSIFKASLLKFGGEDITTEEVKSLLKDSSFKKELKSEKSIEVDEKFGVKINFTAK